MGLTVTDVGLDKKEGKHELKKHAATIHCSNSLSLLQRKISNALLYHAYKELMLREEHEISIKQLCKLISYNGNNHSVIKDALKGLLSTVIEWNVVNDTTGSEDWSASSILASVSLQGPLCLFAYSPRMKQLLHSPTMFAKIDLFIQSRFKSSYGLALYENCIRYRGLAHTKWFEMELFRKLMGVPVDKYTIFRDFKRRVLDKSVEEVNSYSDLLIEPEIQREGRQVTRIRFNLKERPKKTRIGSNMVNDTKVNVESDDSTALDLSNKLIKDYGLSPDQALQTTTEYSAEFIREKIAIVESSQNYLQGKVNNLAAYFLSALKNNYQAGKKRVGQQPQHEANNVLLHERKKMQTTAKKIRKSYQEYREEFIDKTINNMDAVDYDNFIQAFRDHAANSIQTILKLQRNKYKEDTVIESPQIKALIRQFALQVLTNLKDQIISFEEFIEKSPEKIRSMWQEVINHGDSEEILSSA